MRKPYPSDLTDEQWALIEPLIPVYEVGRPREVDMREVLNAILYPNRSGCQRDMLPHDLPPKSAVYDHFARWRDDGTWQRIFSGLQSIKDREGLVDWEIHYIDGSVVRAHKHAAGAKKHR